MTYSKWLIAILKHTPFVKVQESRSFTPDELDNMCNRIMTEKETQWKFNHPNEPFLGVTAEEVVHEIEKRVFER